MVRRFYSSLASVSVWGCLFAGTLLPAACGKARYPDRTYLICLERSVDEGHVAIFHDVAERYGYSFEDNGTEAKRDIEIINPNFSTIPEGYFTFFNIKKNKSNILLGSNIGSNGDEFMVSFFYLKNEDENSPFNKEVISLINSIPDAKVFNYDPETSAYISCADRMAALSKQEN